MRRLTCAMAGHYSCSYMCDHKCAMYRIIRHHTAKALRLGHHDPLVIPWDKRHFFYVTSTVLPCRYQFKTLLQRRCHHVSMLLGPAQALMYLMMRSNIATLNMNRNDAHRQGVYGSGEAIWEGPGFLGRTNVTLLNKTTIDFKLKFFACDKEHSMHNYPKFWSSHSTSCLGEGPPGQVLVLGIVEIKLKSNN